MISEKNGGIVVDVAAKPGSHADRLEWNGEVLTVRVRAKPVDGQANAALAVLISGKLGVPKSAVSIDRGGSGRHKRISVTGVTKERFLALFSGGKP